MRKRCLRLYRQARFTSEGQQSHLVQPLTYMNRSGLIIGHFIPTSHAVSDLIVVCDNLDLPPGMIRIRKGGSSAAHNGLKSLIAHLGSSDHPHLCRIGAGEGTTVVEHVLAAGRK